MKQFTIEEIANALAAYDSMEQDGTTAKYFLHITDDGRILPTLAGADETFTAETDAPNEDGDWREDFEDLANDDFRTVCEDIMEQANDYLQRWAADGPKDDAFEFTEEIFNACTPDRITAADAEKDLENMRRAGWYIPADLTAVRFTKIWNELVDKYEEANRED